MVLGQLCSCCCPSACLPRTGVLSQKRCFCRALMAVGAEAAPTGVHSGTGMLQRRQVSSSVVSCWEGQMCSSFLAAMGLCCRVAADPQLAVPGGAPVKAQEVMVALVPFRRLTQTWLGTMLLMTSRTQRCRRSKSAPQGWRGSWAGTGPENSPCHSEVTGRKRRRRWRLP